jgi:hypothetical protein
MSTGCKVCDDKAVQLLVDRYLDQHIQYTTIARTLVLGGFQVSDGTISTHDKHRVKSLPADVKPSKRDAAVFIKNRVMDALEKLDEEVDPVTGEKGLGHGILAKDLQPALGTALKAQAIEDKREQKKVVQNFWFELGGAIYDAPQLADPNVIEGEARDVTDE